MTDESRRIKDLTSEKRIQLTAHAVRRIIERGIDVEDDIRISLTNSEIIEEYPNDYPYKSYLVYGITAKKQIIHIVCAIDEDNILWIITAYFPDPNEWENDYKTRRK